MGVLQKVDEVAVFVEHFFDIGRHLEKSREGEPPCEPLLIPRLGRSLALPPEGCCGIRCLDLIAVLVDAR